MADSICRRCFHSYVCEQFNEHRDGENDRCHFFNDHFVHAVDAVEVCRCKDCVHGIKDDGGLYQCILGAEYDEETGMYFGFNAWYTEDFFCAHGERRDEDG